MVNYVLPCSFLFPQGRSGGRLRILLGNLSMHNGTTKPVVRKAIPLMGSGYQYGYKLPRAPEKSSKRSKSHMWVSPSTAKTSPGSFFHESGRPKGSVYAAAGVRASLDIGQDLWMGIQYWIHNSNGPMIPSAQPLPVDQRYDGYQHDRRFGRSVTACSVPPMMANTACVLCI